MLETTRERVGRMLAGTPIAAPVEYGIDAVYGVLHPALLRSGATKDEEARSLPGDDLVADATWVATRADTIAAPVDVVWPFIVQMGWGRGGYYAYSFFDPRHTADARGIVPRLQQLEVGDVWLDGPACDEAKGAWRVRVLEPGHSVVLHSLRDPITGRELDPTDRGGRWLDCSWAFVVEPSGRHTTRLLVRTRIALAPAQALLAARLVLGPGDTVMQRTMLRGIRERAERAAAKRTTRRAPTTRRRATGPAAGRTAARSTRPEPSR
jgi:hypothetical protein